MKTTEFQIAAGELRTLTARILKAARQDTEQRLTASHVGISALQYAILTVLSDKNYTLSELSGQMGREPATLLPVVDALETKEMLQRGQDPRDRRRMPLLITGQGRSVLERVPKVGENDLLLKALKGLGERKTEQLISLLREVSLQAAPDKYKTGLKDPLPTHKTRAGQV